MSFIAFKLRGKEVIINTDRIVSVRIDSDKGQTEITCTDQIVVMVDDPEDDIKRKLGVRNPGESVRGFKSA